MPLARNSSRAISGDFSPDHSFTFFFKEKAIILRKSVATAPRSWSPRCRHSWLVNVSTMLLVHFYPGRRPAWQYALRSSTRSGNQDHLVYSHLRYPSYDSTYIQLLPIMSYQLQSDESSRQKRISVAGISPYSPIQSSDACSFIAHRSFTSPPVRVRFQKYAT